MLTAEDIFLDTPTNGQIPKKYDSTKLLTIAAEKNIKLLTIAAEKNIKNSFMLWPSCH
jgi:hypothetical protein